MSSHAMPFFGAPGSRRLPRSMAIAVGVVVVGLALIAFGSAPVAGAGRTYYVDCAGSDSHSGTSSSAAWRTLGKANGAPLAAGDSLLLKRGCSWTGPLQLHRSGTSSAPITVAAYGTGTYPRIQNASNDVEVWGSYIVFRHLWTRADAPGYDSACANQPAGWRVGFRFYSGASHNVVKSSKATNLYTGVMLSPGSHHNKVLNTVFQDNNVKSSDPNSDSGAVAIDIQGDDNEIARNRISGSDACSHFFGGRDGSAVSIYGGQRNSVHNNRTWQNNNFIEVGNSRSADNTIVYNKDTSTLQKATWLVIHGSGSPYGPVLRTRVLNNSVYLSGSESYAIQCVDTCSASYLSFHNNVVWAEDRIGHASPGFDEGDNIYWTSNGQPKVWFPTAASSRKVNPRFANRGAGDLHLTSGSPAIDKASNAAVNLGYTIDDGSTRVPQGGAPDIGAYEWKSGTSTLISDGYQRTISNGWGRAGSGGAYALSGPAAAFDVTGTAGTMSLTAGGTCTAALNGPRSRDVSGTFRVRTDRLATGNGTFAYFAVRRGGGSEYRLKVHFAANRHIGIQATKLVGGTETGLGSEFTTALTHSANTWINVRFRVTGANPTTLVARAWAAGASEPHAWQYRATDSAASLQGSGSFALLAYVAGNTGNGPVLVSFDDWTVVP